MGKDRNGLPIGFQVRRRFSSFFLLFDIDGKKKEQKKTEKNEKGN
jgi:hypothetical protein